MRSLSLRLAVKRVLDSALIMVFSPLIVLALVVSAIAVRVSMGSPVFFTQRRIGLNEAPFAVLKFRTMTGERDESGALLPDRERLTRTGRILRKLSLDELPQLINVLRGEMSLVGPRPLLVEYLPFYRGHERLRHSVRPGITGAAQVAGRNGLLWDQRLEIDARYAQSARLNDDLRIILTTLMKVFRSDGISVIAGDSGERLDVVRTYPQDGTFAIRRLEIADAEACTGWASRSDVLSTFGISRGSSVEDARRWIQETRSSVAGKSLVLVRSSTSEVCALFVATGQDDHTSHHRLVLDPAAATVEVAQAAINLYLEWLRRVPGLERCRITVASDERVAPWLSGRGTQVAAAVDEVCVELEQVEGGALNA